MSKTYRRQKYDSDSYYKRWRKQKQELREESYNDEVQVQESIKNENQNYRCK